MNNEKDDVEKTKKIDLYFLKRDLLNKSQNTSFSFNKGLIPMMIPLWIAILGYGWLPDNFSNGARGLFYITCFGAFLYFLINTLRHAKENSSSSASLEKDLDDDLKKLVEKRSKHKIQKKS